MTDKETVSKLVPILGRVPSGIYILTARHEGQETGMLASWVMQAGFDPPMITVAVKHGRYVADWLHARADFCLNVVAEHEKSLLSHFARGFEPDQPAFEGLEIERLTDEAPVLKTGSIGYLLCRPTGHIDSDDHHIFLAEVVDGHLTSDKPPMLHVRKSGSHY